MVECPLNQLHNTWYLTIETPIVLFFRRGKGFNKLTVQRRQAWARADDVAAAARCR